MTTDFDRLKTALADRYDIREELGAGGMATVYLAGDVNPREIAFFDSAPLGDNEAGMSSTASGAWSNYPFFENGLVVFTSVREGLFVIRVKPPVLLP